MLSQRKAPSMLEGSAGVLPGHVGKPCTVRYHTERVYGREVSGSNGIPELSATKGGTQLPAPSLSP